MQIKELNKNNIQDLMLIYNEQFGNESWSREQVLSAFDNPAIAFFGIFCDDILVSFVSVLRTIDDINILDIATLQHYQGKGFAKKLINFLISNRQQNQTISLEVKSKNIRAITLYQLFGFQTLNIRKKYYKDGDDALCMFLLN